LGFGVDVCAVAANSGIRGFPSRVKAAKRATNGR
jgi:hypothetical protein